MTDAIHHQADPPGVTWDLDIDGHRYIVIEEEPLTGTDCGYTGSREYRYHHGCRCDTCRALRTEAVRRRRDRNREAAS